MLYSHKQLLALGAATMFLNPALAKISVDSETR